MQVIRKRQLLINALTGEVGSGTQVTGYPTNQELRLSSWNERLHLRWLTKAGTDFSVDRALISTRQSTFFPASGTDRRNQLAFFLHESLRILPQPYSSPRQRLSPVVQEAR
jgi:hypothetical protein